MTGRRVVVAAVVEREGRYLIGRRPRHKRHGGLWEFPGGKVLEGESFLEAARRELGEELGVRVLSCGEPRAREPDPASGFLICFVPAEIEGEPVAREHDEVAWAAPGELPSYPLAPADRAFAERLADARPPGGPRDP